MLARGRARLGALGVRAPKLSDVQWTLALGGLMTYILVITSYRVPIGKLAIAAGLVGVFSQPGGVRFPPYLRWMAVFMAWCVAMSYFAAYREWAAQGVQNIVIMTLVALMAVNAMRTRAQVRMLSVFFLFCFILFPMRGAEFNYFFRNFAMGGRAVWIAMYNNPNDLGAMALLQISMALALLMSEQKGWVKTFALIASLLQVFLILLTQSRGVFLALVVLGMIGYSGQKRKVTLAIKGMLALLLLAPLAPSSVWARLATMKHATSTETLEQVDGAEGSARERYEIWQVAKKIIREHPITGVGIGVYKPNHESYAWQSEFSPIARGGRDTHSLYLNVTAETGYPGLALYLGMVLTLLLYAEKVRRRCKRFGLDVGAREILLLQAGYISFLAACVFGSLPYLQHWLLHMALLYSVAELRNREVDELVASGGADAGARQRGMRGPGGAPAVPAVPVVASVAPAAPATWGRRGAGASQPAGYIGSTVVGRTA